MSFARSEIARLVRRVSVVPIERSASRKLSFLVLDPFFAPFFPEEVCARPELLDAGHSFPANLACGLLDNSLEFRRNAERFDLTRRFFRRLTALVPAAPAPEVFLTLPDRVERSYWELLQGYLSAEMLCEAREVTNLELGVFCESVLKSLAHQSELLGLLLRYRLGLLHHAGRTRFEQRFEKGASEGLSQPPLAELELYTDLTAPVRFSAENMRDESFVNAAAAAREMLFEAVAKH